MSVDRSTVLRVAHLARIRVAEAEVDKLQGELNSILGFVDELSGLDVSDVEPLTSIVPIAMKKRADVVTDGDIPKKVTQNAPLAEDDYFVVPKVVE
jgi:aspartyl-tRNA(Asn)/glutamyl-tRNA(Gln) amidotransferase subunit C